MDKLTKNDRSILMAKIHGKETKLEVKLRSALHRKGFRFRKNVKSLPGTPDIVLPKYRAIVFVHGCFWHSHQNCRKGRRPTSRKEYWEAKLDANISRDLKKIEDLERLRWRIAVVWGCALSKSTLTNEAIDMLIQWIPSTDRYLEIPRPIG